MPSKINKPKLVYTNSDGTRTSISDQTCDYLNNYKKECNSAVYISDNSSKKCSYNGGNNECYVATTHATPNSFK